MLSSVTLYCSQLSEISSYSQKFTSRNLVERRGPMSLRCFYTQVVQSRDKMSLTRRSSCSTFSISPQSFRCSLLSAQPCSSGQEACGRREEESCSQVEIWIQASMPTGFEHLTGHLHRWRQPAPTEEKRWRDARKIYWFNLRNDISSRINYSKQAWGLTSANMFW